MADKSLEERQAEMRARMSASVPNNVVEKAVSLAEETTPIELKQVLDASEPLLDVGSQGRRGITVTRKQLYDLVWKEPMTKVAQRVQVSDVAVSKACRNHQIPVPERGYWNKLKAGKKVFRMALPPRGLGRSDEVTIGGGNRRYYYDPDIDFLNDPIPPPPVFDVEMDSVRSKVIAMVNKAPLPKTIGERQHPQIAKLLASDEERLQKYQASKYPSSWDAPIFNTPFESRRLKILNGLFICLQSCGMSPSISGKHGRDLSVAIGHQRVWFSLDAAGAERQLERERMGYGFEPRNQKDKLRLSLSSWHHSQRDCRSWQDDDAGRVESHLREIAIELIVSGEQAYRDGIIHSRERRIERRAELLEEERKRKLEEERKRRERQAKLEQARVRHLLGQADAMHQAVRIRAYIAAIHEANRAAPQPMSPDELESWTQWAMAQADRIDPVLSGAYKSRPTEPEE